MHARRSNQQQQQEHAEGAARVMQKVQPEGRTSAAQTLSDM
jgi:hypothetical protein